MVASPLSSPEGLFVSAGLFGWPFALAAFVSSILLGLTGGAVAAMAENLGLLKNQARFADSNPITLPATSGCGCQDQTSPEKPAIPIPVCGCSTLVPVAAGDGALISFSSIQPVMERCSCELPAGGPIPSLAVTGSVSEEIVVKSKVRLSELATEMLKSGKQLLPMFLGFAFVGYFLNGLIPTSWVSALFGSGNIYSVPLAATLGLPLYFNGEASLPLVRAMLDGGMSQGAALAFIISGAGTSFGAIAGALTIARWRVVSLVVIVLWAGAILTGYAFNFLQAVNLF
jgi:uncharacterized membrane protein YraQ (UPF0718 family)